MRRGDLDRFFRELSRKIHVPARIYLTGGTAAWLWGGTRPTDDIDFGLKVDRRGWDTIQNLIQETSRRLGIPVQFSEDIGRWGMVGISDYEKEAKFYKRFGHLSVFLLDVADWSVGKVGRYYQSDVDDLRAVFKKQKPKLRKIIGVWARALHESPRSSSQSLFVKTVEDFLKNYGREIWGKPFNLQQARAEFQKLC